MRGTLAFQAVASAIARGDRTKEAHLLLVIIHWRGDNIRRLSFDVTVMVTHPEDSTIGIVVEPLVVIDSLHDGPTNYISPVLDPVPPLVEGINYQANQSGYADAVGLLAFQHIVDSFFDHEVLCAHSLSSYHWRIAFMVSGDRKMMWPSCSIRKVRS